MNVKPREAWLGDCIENMKFAWAKINLNSNMNNVHQTWTQTLLATNVKIGEHEFEFKLENVYDGKLLLQPMWIWQTS